MAESSIQSSGLEEKLGRLPLAVRSSVLTSSLKKAVKPIVRELKSRIPRGRARTGEKSGKKHLRDTITDKTFEFKNGAGAIAGARYPQGAHFHLVDRGFLHAKSKAWVPGKRLLIESLNAAGEEVEKIFEAELEKKIKDA